MNGFPDRVKAVFKGDINPLPSDIVFEKKQHLPGAVNYSIIRYLANEAIAQEETGFLAYTLHQSEPEKSFIQLSFCVAGNKWNADKNFFIFILPRLFLTSLFKT